MVEFQKETVLKKVVIYHVGTTHTNDPALEHTNTNFLLLTLSIYKQESNSNQFQVVLFAAKESTKEAFEIGLSELSNRTLKPSRKRSTNTLNLKLPRHRNMTQWPKK